MYIVRFNHTFHWLLGLYFIRMNSKNLELKFPFFLNNFFFLWKFCKKNLLFLSKFYLRNLQIRFSFLFEQVKVLHSRTHSSHRNTVLGYDHELYGNIKKIFFFFEYITQRYRLCLKQILSIPRIEYHRHV